jgi:hypothetical protein
MAVEQAKHKGIAEGRRHRAEGRRQKLRKSRASP